MICYLCQYFFFLTEDRWSSLIILSGLLTAYLMDSPFTAYLYNSTFMIIINCSSVNLLLQAEKRQGPVFCSHDVHIFCYCSMVRLISTAAACWYRQTLTLILHATNTPHSLSSYLFDLLPSHT